MRADTDRATHDREVLGAHQHRATVDRSVAGDETVGRREWRHPAADAAGVHAELHEAVRIEEPLDARAGVEPTVGPLTRESLGAAHGRCRGPAPREILEQRVPVAHAEGRLAATRSACASPLPNSVSSTHPRFR